MFRRLRERIAEEANRFPVAQDLITLSDSSAVIDPLPQQFSIAGDEDASFSDPNSPQKKANSSAGSELYSTPNSKSMLDANSVTSSNRSSAPSYIPQTDIESEMEEPPTLNLDGISKEQLLSTIDILKAKLCKYKNKYSEVVKAYKNLNEEKKKLEHALTENQDKSLRRIAELREQCQLEQKAKAHLEENLRLILEEKDSRISVLETQINLLKEGQSDQSSFAPKEPERSSGNEQNELSDVPLTPENSALQEKVQKLQALLKECKVTILSKTEHITELSREKEVLCQKIVTLSKSSEEFEEKEANIRMEYENTIEGLKSRLTELEQQQEDSIMSMAETKKNMHEELELKERQLVKAKEDARQFQLAVEHEKAVNAELRKQHDEKIKDLQNQLETTEKVMEEGKQTLIRELSRGKAEAVALIQQESVKKVAALEEEWSAKLRSLEMKLEEFKNKDEGCTNILKEKEEELLSAVRELDAVKEKLQVIEEEKSTLESCVKELESEKHMAAENCSISSKLEKIEERYQEEISKLKYDISQLEEEKHRLSSDHELRIAAMGDELKIKLDEQATEFLSKLQSKDDELIQIQSESEKNENKLKDVLQELKQETERRFSELSSELKSKENELKELQTEAENRDKELRETIRNLRADLEEKQNYTAELSSRLDSKEMELIHIQAETKKSEDELKETIHKLQTDLNGKHNEVSQLSEELKTKEENLKHVQGQSQKEVKELKDAIQKLQEEVRAEQSQSGLLSELESKTSKLRQELCESEDREMKLNETLLKLHADLKDKESALDLLEKELSSVKATDSVKMDEFNKKIKQLEHEREQLMLQAQERVAATELKYREDIAQLQEKVQDLLIQNKEIAKLKSENSKLSYQLDESLLVAASNQSAATSEMSKLKEQLQQLTEQLSEKDKLCCEKDEELNRTVSDLQGLKEEKEILNQQLKSIELEVAHAKDLEERVSSLQHENKNLRSELDSVTVLKQEKDNLNAKISSLEHSKKDMAETIKLLKSENENLRTKESSLNQEVSSLKSERESLANKLQESETSNSECLECASLKSSIDELHSEYEKKLELKDAEMEDKVKLVIKEFYSQMNIKDSDCDQTISELIDCSKGIEEKLQKEHRLEIAALRQDIFEKDCALEEMHEHYEGIIKEKDALINEYEKNLKAANAVKNFELPNAEASDWDDTWAVPEESCENISPAHSNNVDCDKHKEEIENLREELEKCNTELKDLRILLRLTPPQSLHSNNNYSSLIPISEPTEFEYLKNILFQYMMGRETVILVKVIAAVLRFSDEQTRLVVEREKSKPQSK